MKYVPLDILIDNLEASQKQKEVRQTALRYHLPKDNAKPHISRELLRRKATARRLFNEISSIQKWTKAKRAKAHAALHKLRPNVRQVQHYYVQRGDSPAIARLLTKNYETLPIVHLNRKDFYVLRDIINGDADKHTSYIERELNNT